MGSPIGLLHAHAAHHTQSRVCDGARSEPPVEVDRAVLICTAIRPLPQRHVLRAFAQGCRTPSHYTPCGCVSAACAFLWGFRPARLQQSSVTAVSESLVIRLRDVRWLARIMSGLSERSRARR